MNYKKIIRSRSLRYKILKLLSWIPNSVMLRLQYRIKMGVWPNFKHPKRYTEKLQLYKMKYRNSIMPKCVDKYDVRDYVNSKGLGSILNDCFGIYDNYHEIDWEKLPQKFVAKNTTGGGGLDVVLVKNKDDKNRDELFQMFDKWTRPRNNYSSGREWAYTGIEKNRIIIEALLEDDSNSDGSIDDFKFMCFSGKFKYLWVDKDRYSNHHRGFWDKNLNFLPNVSSDHDTFENPPSLPSNIDEMIKIAEKLSEDFPYARIDLYNIKGKIYFGEITFYPWSGYVKFHPDSFDFELGECFDISSFK